MATTYAGLVKLFQDTYSQVITDSLTRRGIADAANFVQPTSILALLRDRGRIKMAGQTGDEFEGTQFAGQWKHLYASGQVGGSFAESDAFLAAGDDNYENAALPWKSLWEPMEVSGLAIDTAQGASVPGDLNIWMRRFENALRDLFDSIEDQLLLDGTGNAGNDVDGIFAFLKQVGTYAGISVAANAWWRPFLEDAAAAALTLDMMRSVKYQLRDRKCSWDVILCSSLQQDKYRDLLGDKLRYTNISMGDIEREVPTFDGKPVIDVQGWPDTKMAFLDTKMMCARFLPPKLDPDANSERADYQGLPIRVRYVQPTKDADQAHLIARLNLLYKNPFKAGYIDNLAVV